MKKRQKTICTILTILLTISLTGCQNNKMDAFDLDLSDDEYGNTDAEQAADNQQNYKSIEEIIMEIENEGTVAYKVYAPKGSSVKEDTIKYTNYDEGITFFATSCACPSGSAFFTSLDNTAEMVASMYEEYPNIEEINKSNIKKNGKDLYEYVSAKYNKSREIELVYLDNQEDGMAILYTLTISEKNKTDTTDSIIDELTDYWGISPDPLKSSFSWTDEYDLTEEQKEGFLNGEMDGLPDTILWFNATYAVLTYNNGCNWHMISGMEKTNKNAEYLKSSLENSWGVTDRESAIETIESLKKNGHRNKCRECMKTLKRTGLMKMDEKAFTEKLKQMVTEEEYNRFYIAYTMYHDGIDPEYMAAWDLCRVNMLYHDYYFCGYMTYEEAMDGCLENSLILQSMYSSWEQMMDAYILGFQFWQGDASNDIYSPTHERLNKYLELKDSDDSPYDMDFKMNLEKCW